MKNYFKISLGVVALLSFVTTANANREFAEFEDVEFESVLKCFHKKKQITIQGKDYVVLRKYPKEYVFQETQESSTTLPKIMEFALQIIEDQDVEHLMEIQKKANFLNCMPKESPDKQYALLNFRSYDNPDWSNEFTSNAPRRYWNKHNDYEHHIADFFYVTFLLKSVD